VALILHGCIYAQEPAAIAGKKEDKPLLFSSVPDEFEVDQTLLQKIFSADLNSPITLQLSSQFSIQGKVVDKNHHNPGTVTVNLRLSNYQNAIFNVTMRLLADNSTSIQGRILHPKYGDVLVLFKEKDRYYIRKSSQRLYMPE
jgi:hypothetical protein